MFTKIDAFEQKYAYVDWWVCPCNVDAYGNKLIDVIKLLYSLFYFEKRSLIMRFFLSF